MNPITPAPIKYSAEADAALIALYAKYGESQTVEQKINVLQEELGQSHFYASDGEVPQETKLACLECEWLAVNGKIELELA